MKLACETCPWYAPRTGADSYGTCHHAGNPISANMEDAPMPDYWCSLHPAAPKPIYELGIVHPETTLHDGWEPMPATDSLGNVLVRRIIGYTSGGE